jgi:hypothetical protein
VDRRIIWLSLGCLGACADAREPDAATSASASISISVSAGTDVDTSADGSGAASDDPGVLDVAAEGAGSADDGGSGQGCKKVDFLFVIDNSGSMSDEQDSLIASFPGFIQTIQTTLTDAQDYHVLVTDTDAAWGGECPLLCGFFNGTCPDIPSYPCDAGPPSVCDTTLGAGVTYPLGSDATNQLCAFTSGHRFMDATQPDLSAAFQCAAKVGSDGDGNEKAMSALVGALSEELALPGGCNEDFIRDDAILVVTFITDEEDKGSTGLPEGWFANVIASKKGDEAAVVMLGLINDADQPAPLCPADTEDAVKLRTFVEMFPNSIRGSVCEPSYNAFFEQAVALIDQTCDDFVPAG